LVESGVTARSLSALAVTVLATAATGCGGGGMAAIVSPTPSVSPQELRQNTVSVQVAAPERISALYHGIAERLRQKGKQELADFFEAQTGGGFGSGFVLKRDGMTFVVTNRHVVDFEDGADVAIEGAPSAFSAEVIYADRTYDLAVLAFEDAAPNVAGLRLAATRVHDLETVVATGYPGLGGQPSYQATRGQVSNERFAMQTRGVPLTFIQHTAPIDPGSSGGPLSTEHGVVGVNTMKASGRDNVYLAIPSEAISEVLDRAVVTLRGRQDQKWLVAQLADSCGRLVAGLRREGEPSIDIYDLITNDVVAEHGFESTDPLMKTSKDLGALFYENPTMTLRIGVAMRLWNEAHGKEGLPVSCLGVTQDPNANAVRLQVKFERATRDTYWRFEQGFWKLAAFDKMTSNAPPPKAKTKPKK
jgi:serine protease Do